MTVFSTSSFCVILIITLCKLCCYCKENEGYDLDPSSEIRIGVKKRVKDCKKRAFHGQKMVVHYVGSLYKDNSKVFDSSRERGDPFEFHLGKMEVIPGLDKGVRGMCVGEIRKLTIPSEYAYGDVGAPPDIHPGATLVYELELLDILPADKEEYETTNDDDGFYYELSHFEDL